jgi:hypothetical protein
VSGCGRRWTHLDTEVVCSNRQTNHRYCLAWCDAEFGIVETPNPDYVAPKVVTGGEGAAQSALEGMRGRVAPDPTSDGFPAGLEASEASAATWTDQQKAQVRTAIRIVCERHAGGGEFTTDDIWAQLAGKVPVTKGMTAMLNRANKDGWLDNTGKTRIAERGGKHDHGQRLTIWYSLMDPKL